MGLGDRRGRLRENDEEPARKCMFKIAGITRSLCELMKIAAILIMDGSGRFLGQTLGAVIRRIVKGGDPFDDFSVKADAVFLRADFAQAIEEAEIEKEARSLEKLE